MRQGREDILIYKIFVINGLLMGICGFVFFIQERGYRDSSELYPSAFLLLAAGGAMALFGIYKIVQLKQKERKQEKLLTEGQVLSAVVDKIQKNLDVMSGRTSYVIYCSYYDEYQDKTYHFKSRTLWYNPAPDYPDGCHITVYLDTKDSNFYYVDVQRGLSKEL
ncbi:MAG: hypothetical protein ACI39N_02610 [Lachnospiraceae bacterium]